MPSKRRKRRVGRYDRGGNGGYGPLDGHTEASQGIVAGGRCDTQESISRNLRIEVVKGSEPWYSHVMAQTTRKARRKATTDLGRSIMQRERQRLAREQAALAEKLAEDAAAARSLPEEANVAQPMQDADRAIQRSIVRRVAGVLASEGVNASIEVQPIPATAPLDAWTDFNRIHVGYHLQEDVKLTAAVLRGLFYHEGGHCRWTVPFTDLLELVRIAGARRSTP